MNIVCLNKVDFSGAGYNLCEAINRLTPHKATSIALAHNIFKYPTHISYTTETVEHVRRLIRNADVVILREFFELPQLFGQSLTSKQTVVMSMGGWRFRDPAWRNKTISHFKRRRKIKWAITSADFIPDFPAATFIPCCVDTDGLRAKYLSPKQEPPLVMHSPSDPFHMNQSGEAFIKAIDTLWKQDHEFDAEVIIGQTNNECLTVKGTASIFFDRFEYLYGVNSIEAATLECAVVTYTSPETLQNLSKHAGMICPFIIVDDYQKLLTNLKWLLEDEDKRLQLGNDCCQYVQKLHNGEYSVKQLMEMIQS